MIVFTTNNQSAIPREGIRSIEHCLALAVITVCAAEVTGQQCDPSTPPCNQQSASVTLPQSDPVLLGDTRGTAVAAAGVVAMVGADQRYQGEDGYVTVYEHDGSDWVDVARLTSSSIDPGERFGSAVDCGIDSGIVGSPFRSTNHSDDGAAFVIQDSASGWATVALLRSPSPEPVGLFGSSVALLEVGTEVVAVVGAPGEDSVGAPNAGRAYVFRQNTTPSSWQHVATLEAPTPEAQSRFGSSVAIIDHPATGLTIFVGAPNADSFAAAPDGGAVFVFREDGSTPDLWSADPDPLVNPDAREADHFGAALSADGNRVVACPPKSVPVIMRVPQTSGRGRETLDLET